MTAVGATDSVVAVDIGGTKLAVGIVGADGRIQDRRLVPTPRDHSIAGVDRQPAGRVCARPACGYGLVVESVNVTWAL